MKTLLLFFLSAASLFAQVTGTTAQPLARDATTFNLNRTRLDIGTGTTLKWESGSTFNIENGTTITIGATAATDFATALNLGVGVKTFADSTARNAATPAATGQIGIQLDDKSIWNANSTTAGDWSGAFGTVTIRGGSGSASVPSLSFTTDTDSGFYRSASNEIGVTLNGALTQKFTAGQMLIPDGNEAAPGLAFLDDATSGFFRIGDDDAIGFSFGGIELFRVYSGATNFGGVLNADSISATTYEGNILLNNAGSVTVPAYSRSTDTNTGIYFPAADQIAFTSGGTQSGLFTSTLATFPAISTPGAATVTGLVTGGSYATIAANGDGSATVPFITRATDTNTGLYFPAADQVALTTGGTARVTVTDATTTISNAVAASSLSLTTALPVASGGTGSTTAAAARTALGAHSTDYIKLSHTVADGTNGGTATSGSWLTATVNTEDVDTGSLCTLSSNEFALAAGTYRYSISCIFYNTGYTQMRLYNVTDATVVDYGLSEYFSAGHDRASVMEGRFTLASTKTLRLEYRCTLTSMTYGLGEATTWSGNNEVYRIITITRE